MLRDFLNGILELSGRAEEPRTLKLPDGRLLYEMPSGTTGEVAMLRNIHDAVDSYQSLVDFAGAFAAPLVFHVGRTSARAYIDRERDGPRVECELAYRRSAAFECLLDWYGSPKTVRQVVRALRGPLDQTCTDEYRGIFKRLDFSRRNDGSRSATHTGESMGRTIEAKAQSSAGEIPEVVVFDCVLFANLPVESYELRFAVEVDPDSEKVGIHPIGDCIDVAIQATRNDVAARLRTEFSDFCVLETV